MKNQDELTNEIEKTLGILGGITTAEPKPFFYTRLKARMESKQMQVPVQVRWFLKPAVLYGTLGILLLLNVVSIINYSKKAGAGENTSKEQTLESFAKEYSLNDSSN